MIKKKSRRNRDDEEDNGFAAWGGYMAAKKAKLEDQFQDQVEKGSEQKSNIFKGIAIFVNGYTVPTAGELKKIMMDHGGVYHHYESHSTTHIIASNLPDTKVKVLKTLNVVKPSWIVESLAAGTLLDYRKYLLYSNQSKSQPRLNFPQKGTSANVNTTHVAPSVSGLIDKGTVPQELNSVSEIANEGSSCDLETIVTCEDSLRGKSNCEVNKQVMGANVTTPLNSKFSGAPKISAKEPEFLSKFYENSRLHHLSTMGALFKNYVAQLREGSQGEFPGLKRLNDWKKSIGRREDLGEDDFLDDLTEDSVVNQGGRKVAASPRTIMHIDMDCFFVSVGLRRQPELRGYPVAVTHARGNTSRPREGANRQYERDFYKQKFENKMKQKQGQMLQMDEDAERKWRLDDVSENDSLSEIASCNYEARKAGVKNGMFFGTAIKLCPDLKTIPYDFKGYKEVSYKLYDTLASYTLDIEAVSCDEMYVDCTEVLKKADVTALEFATFLRAEIHEATGCTASAGFGNNPLQARLATKKAKPNGQFLLQPVDVELFMHNIKVEDLPGVGHSLAYRLHAEGITTCRDLQRLPLTSLQRKFGRRTGEALHQHARGEDQRRLDLHHQRKSVSAEVNYGIRFSTQSEAESFLHQLAEEVAQRTRQARVRGRQVTLKLMVRAKDAPIETAKFMGHGACDHISRSTTLGAPTDDANVIYREAVALQRQQKVLPSDLRGVGIQMSRLVKLSSKGSAKDSVLTRFLSKNKAGERNAQEQKDTSKESCRGGTNGNEPSSKSVPAVAKTGTVEVAKKASGSRVDSDSHSVVDRPAVSDCLLNERELDKLNEFKKNHSNDGKKETASRSKTVHDALQQKQQNNLLPVLSPPIEVPMLTLVQARKLIRAWVTSEDSPQRCDVVMFASHIQRLVLARHLEDVDILISLLHRMLINKGLKWKEAYRDVVENTQAVMQVVYGADLQVPEFD